MRSHLKIEDVERIIKDASNQVLDMAIENRDLKVENQSLRAELAHYKNMYRKVPPIDMHDKHSWPGDEEILKAEESRGLTRIK